MYTQYQKGLSMVLLTSLFLQSCGNLALNGYHQMKVDTPEATSYTSSKRQPLVIAEAPPAAPAPQQGEERQTESRTVPPGNVASVSGRATASSTSPVQRKRPSATPKQAPRMASPVRPKVRAQEENGTNLGAWHAQVREKIEALGKTKPGEASRLSQAMLGGYQGTPAQREALKALDMAPLDASLRPGLRGGMIAGEIIVPDVAAGLLVTMFRKGVRLIRTGNEAAIEKIVGDREMQVEAEIGDIRGMHRGARCRGGGQRRSTNGRFTLTPQYYPVASGEGQFVASGFEYKGNFVNGTFDDTSGEARLIFNGDKLPIEDARIRALGNEAKFRYTGDFREGLMHGAQGTLAVFDGEKGDYRKLFSGRWERGKPVSGAFYDRDGNETDRIETERERSERERRELEEERRRLEQERGEQDPALAERLQEVEAQLKRLREEERARQEREAKEEEGEEEQKESHSITSRIDLTVPPEEVLLIARKLNNPEQELTPDESIELLTTCVAYGTERAKRIEGKPGIIVLGNTGAGKSTFINFLAGCTMELTSPRALGMTGSRQVAVVRAPEQGGARPEMTPIGHSRQSHTFMPEIAPAPDSDFVYCDCPGFLDNRGAEINIANAINVKNTLVAARNVRVVLLLNYHALHADKARGLDDMLKICTDLFGSVENLERYAPSLLLGITQVPQDTDIEGLKEDVIDERHPITRVLADRLFVYNVAGGDDTPPEGWWDRNECLARIAALPPIEAPSTIFRTVLTDSDERRLLAISQGIGERVKVALDENDFPRAAEHLDHLGRLSIIEHNEMGRITERATRDLRAHFQGKIYAFKESCLRERFSMTEGLLREFREGCEVLGDKLVGIVDLVQLEDELQEAQARHEERVKREEETRSTIQDLIEKEREKRELLGKQQAELVAMQEAMAQRDVSNKELQEEHRKALEEQQRIVQQSERDRERIEAEQKRAIEQQQEQRQRDRKQFEAEQKRLIDQMQQESRQAQERFEAEQKRLIDQMQQESRQAQERFEAERKRLIDQVMQSQREQVQLQQWYQQAQERSEADQKKQQEQLQSLQEQLQSLQEQLQDQERQAQEQREADLKRQQVEGDGAYAVVIQDELDEENRKVQQAEREAEQKRQQEQLQRLQEQLQRLQEEERSKQRKELQSFKYNIGDLYGSGYSRGTGASTAAQEQVFINMLPGIHRLTSSLCPTRGGSVDQFIYDVLPRIQEGIRHRVAERLREALRKLPGSSDTHWGGIMGGRYLCYPTKIFEHLYAIIAHYQGTPLEGELLSRIRTELANEGRGFKRRDPEGFFPTAGAPGDGTYVSYILLVMYCAAAEFLVEHPRPNEGV